MPRPLRIEYPVGAGVWTGSELEQRAKGDARKFRIARRLRAATAVTFKWITVELRMGAWTHLSNLLANAKQTESTNKSEFNLCQ